MVGLESVLNRLTLTLDINWKLGRAAIWNEVICKVLTLYQITQKMKLSLCSHLKLLTRLMWLEDVIVNHCHGTQNNLVKLVRKKPFTFQHSN